MTEPVDPGPHTELEREKAALLVHRKGGLWAAVWVRQKEDLWELQRD